MQSFSICILNLDCSCQCGLGGLSSSPFSLLLELAQGNMPRLEACFACDKAWHGCASSKPLTFCMILTCCAGTGRWL